MFDPYGITYDLFWQDAHKNLIRKTILREEHTESVLVNNPEWVKHRVKSMLRILPDITSGRHGLAMVTPAKVVMVMSPGHSANLVFDQVALNASLDMSTCSLRTYEMFFTPTN